MKSLASYLECAASTPASTIGMGNPSAPEGDGVGSGDIFVPTAKCKTERDRKRRIRKKELTEGIMDASLDIDDSTLLKDILRAGIPAGELVNNLSAWLKANRSATKTRYKFNGDNYVCLFFTKRPWANFQEKGGDSYDICGYFKTDETYGLGITDLADLYEMYGSVEELEAHYNDSNVEVWKIRDLKVWRQIIDCVNKVFDESTYH